MKKYLPLLFFFVGVLFVVACNSSFSPTLTSWKIAGQLPPLHGESKALGVAGPATGISNNVMIVAGGANFPDSMPWLGGRKKYYADIYLFKKDSADSLHFIKNLSLPFTLAYSATCTTPYGVFAGGGENENGLRRSAFLMMWDPSTDSIIIRTLPDLPFAVTNASAICMDSTIYLAGGERTSDVSKEFMSLDLSDPVAKWRILEQLPRAASHGVMASSRQEIYFIGGRKKNPGRTSDLYKYVSRYNLPNKTWSETDSLPFPLSAGTAVSIYYRYIVLIGGDRGETFHKTEELLAEIAAATSDSEKAILNARKAKIQALHPGFFQRALLFERQRYDWQLLDTIPFPATATTSAFIWDDKIFIPSGEIRAGVRTPNIYSAKIESK